MARCGKRVHEEPLWWTAAATPRSQDQFDAPACPSQHPSSSDRVLLVQAHRIMVAKVHTAQVAQQHLLRTTLAPARQCVCRNITLTLPTSVVHAVPSLSSALTARTSSTPADEVGGPSEAVGVLEFDVSQDSTQRVSAKQLARGHRARTVSTVARAEIALITWQDAPLQGSEEADAKASPACARTSERLESAASAVVRVAHAMGHTSVDRTAAMAQLQEETRALVCCVLCCVLCVTTKQ